MNIQFVENRFICTRTVFTSTLYLFVQLLKWYLKYIPSFTYKQNKNIICIERNTLASLRLSPPPSTLYEITTLSLSLTYPPISQYSFGPNSPSLPPANSSTSLFVVYVLVTVQPRADLTSTLACKVGSGPCPYHLALRLVLLHKIPCCF